MKRTIITFMAIIFTSSVYSKPVSDTISAFNLGISYIDTSITQNEKLTKLRDIEIEIERKMAIQHYELWNGVTSPEILIYEGFHNGKMIGLSDIARIEAYISFIGTDYFEIHFAKEYFDSTYRLELEKQGKELAQKYLLKEPRNKKDLEYYHILQKTQAIIPENDFYLMLAFAKRLNRKIYVMRINSNKKNDLRFTDKFYLLLSTPDIFKSCNEKYNFFIPLTSSEIPTNYVIQDKFDQF